MKNTSYEELYKRFLGKIDDYALAKEIIQDADLAERTMLGHLNNAISKYSYPTQDFSKRDDKEKTFLFTLTDTEQEILAMLMVADFLSPKLIRSDIMEQRLGSSDFKQYSPANLMSEIRGLKRDLESDARALMVIEYYRGGI